MISFAILVSFGSGLLGIYPTVKLVKEYKQEKNEIINDCNKENIEQKIKEKNEEINFCHTKLIEDRNLYEKFNESKTEYGMFLMPFLQGSLWKYN